MDNACRECKRLVAGPECTVCRSKELTKNWKGTLVVYDPECELGKRSGHEVAGKFALHVL